MLTQHRITPSLTRVGFAALLGELALASTFALGEVAHPAKLSAEALTGAGFTHPDTIVTETPTGNILDFTSLKSSDGKFASGMYAAGAQRFEITEPYGVDEFMFFLEGSVTLTSSDGTITVVNAGARHRLAADPQEKGAGGVADQLLIEVNSHLHVVVGRGGEAGRHPLAGQRQTQSRPPGLQGKRRLVELHSGRRDLLDSTGVLNWLAGRMVWFRA